MNNIILIRGDHVAFSKLPGNWGSGFGYSSPDLTDLMTTMGMFIPCHDHGMQAFYGLDKDPLFKPLTLPGAHTVTLGNKGLLITPDYDDGVEFHHVRMTETRQLNSMPIRTGKHGFHIVSSNDANADLMSMAVRLTDTIEAAVDMYCRHVMSNRNHVLIMSKAELKKYLAIHYLPKVVAKLAADEKRELAEKLEVKQKLKRRPRKVV